jgi:FeS assembly SUF system protein
MNDQGSGNPIEKIRTDAMHSQIVEVLKTVYDPEIPVNIYDLGLIYDIAIDPEQNVHVNMTLTSPMCPVAGSLPPEVRSRVAGVDGVREATVDVVWDPPWSPQKMSDAARLQLNM